jgi:hypothetical protein
LLPGLNVLLGNGSQEVVAVVEFALLPLSSFLGQRLFLVTLGSMKKPSS